MFKLPPKRNNAVTERVLLASEEGSVNSLTCEKPTLPPWARCRVDNEFTYKFWLCFGTLTSTEKSHLSVENRDACLALQTKEQRHTWLLVSAHHDDGWILFSKVKISDPYVKTIYLSVQKIMSKVFLHLLMTGIGEKEDGLKFCRCQLWLSLNTLSTVVITQLFIAPAQKGAEGPEQLSPAVEIPLAHLSKDSCLVCSLLNRHHPLPTCL